MSDDKRDEVFITFDQLDYVSATTVKSNGKVLGYSAGYRVRIMGDLFGVFRVPPEYLGCVDDKHSKAMEGRDDDERGSTGEA